ncbi:IMV membrane protein [Carp edema virus]|nr:IMV membrane protein [Carp edema virus]
MTDKEVYVDPTRVDKFEIHGNQIKHIGLSNFSKATINNDAVVFLSIIFIVGSIIVMFLQIQNFEFFDNVKKYNRIKHNMNNWVDSVYEKDAIEIMNNKKNIIQSKNQLTQFQCLDMGLYYIPIRINPEYNLPESIRRGDGGAWKILKSDVNDVAALQFCNYVLLNNKNNYIRCGMDSFSKLGNSGWFDSTHWCRFDTKKLLEKYSL